MRRCTGRAATRTAGAAHQANCHRLQRPACAPSASCARAARSSPGPVASAVRGAFESLGAEQVRSRDLSCVGICSKLGVVEARPFRCTCRLQRVRLHRDTFRHVCVGCLRGLRGVVEAGGTRGRLQARRPGRLQARRPGRLQARRRLALAAEALQHALGRILPPPSSCPTRRLASAVLCPLPPRRPAPLSRWRPRPDTACSPSAIAAAHLPPDRHLLASTDKRYLGPKISLGPWSVHVDANV